MKSSAFLLITLFSTQVFAWGNLGHRAVGEIATGRLSKEARSAVLEIGAGESLAQLSTWADEVRSDESFKWLKPYHFISIDHSTMDHEHHDAELSDAYNGIKKNIEVLKSSGASLADKRQALAILTHLVGDIHQPLHAGYTRDYGGNSCKVQYFGKLTNLHSVMDSAILERVGRSYEATVRLILSQKKKLLGKDDLKQLAKDGAHVWIQESIDLRDGLYVSKLNSTWEFESGNTDEYFEKRSYCNLARDEKNTALMPNLSTLYNSKVEKLIRRRLLLAGVRLAHVLNEAFAAESKQE